jgi:UDP-3-O-[3-hydroxymyristoyl] N-acetylglucosamine deacetylase
MPKPALAPQFTLRERIHCTGVGLHSGVKATIALNPAPANSGIVFRRTDLPQGPVEIAAHWSQAIESPMCSVLTDGQGAEILTIEHLMSALAGASVDNCLIEIDGPEVPIMDGSAEAFLFLIECAGLQAQNAPKRAIQVLRAVEVGDSRASARLEPADDFRLSFEIDFKSAAIRHQATEIGFDPAVYKTEISRARTFGFMADFDALRASGRALGASLDNVIAIDTEDRVMNEGGLRFRDEFVRHKVLDAIGDLYLAGAAIRGRFQGIRSSHALNRRLLAALFAEPANWAWRPLTLERDPVEPYWPEARALSA